MKRLSALLCAGFLAGSSLASEAAMPAPLTVAQILERNAAARGGLEAWRKVQTMAWTGHVESSNAQAPRVPFLLELERPNKTHFELTSMSQRLLRIFDGRTGWKLQPPRGGGFPEVQTFTPQEAKFAREEQVIDGVLLDHEAKGLAVALEGMDEIEGHPAYRMNVSSMSGINHRVWIDATTFLDIKADHPSQGAAGPSNAAVAVYYRDYREFDGLQIPCVIETSSGPGGTPDRVVIERVALNPSLNDREFAKPGMPVRRRGITIDVEPTPAATDAAGRPGR